MLHITNHAVRRYAERVLGFHTRGRFDAMKLEMGLGISVQSIRERINADVEPHIPHTVLFRGTRRVIRGLDARYVVNGGKVHTCYKGNERDFDDD